MSVAAFAAELPGVLIADAGLQAWASTHFGKAITAKTANRKLNSLDPKAMPVLVLEAGDGDAEITIGNEIQTVQAQVLGAVLWYEQDHDSIFTQRFQLVDALVKALQADATVSATAVSCWVSDYETDRGANHPMQVMRFTIQAEVEVFAA